MLDFQRLGKVEQLQAARLSRGRGTVGEVVGAPSPGLSVTLLRLSLSKKGARCRVLFNRRQTILRRGELLFVVLELALHARAMLAKSAFTRRRHRPPMKELVETTMPLPYFPQVCECQKFNPLSRQSNPLRGPHARTPIR